MTKTAKSSPIYFIIRITRIEVILRSATAIINGQSDFMVNPDFVVIGKNKKIRVAEWNRRCEAYLKKLESKSTKIRL